MLQYTILKMLHVCVCVCVRLVEVQLVVHSSSHLLLTWRLGAFLWQVKTCSKLAIHWLQIVCWTKLCSESQKLGFFRLQDDLPTLLRHLWKIGHLHDGSICRQDLGSFAKILTTHETAGCSLHAQNVGIQCTFDKSLATATCTHGTPESVETCCTAVAVETVQSNS